SQARLALPAPTPGARAAPRPRPHNPVPFRSLREPSMQHPWVILAFVALACRGAVAQQVPEKSDTPAQPTGAATPGQTEPSPESLEHRDPSWVIDIEPAAWFVGASGRVRLPRSTPTG